MVPFLTEPPRSVPREAAPFEVPAKGARAVGTVVRGHVGAGGAAADAGRRGAAAGSAAMRMPRALAIRRIAAVLAPW